MGVLTEYQKFWVRVQVKEKIPDFDDEIIDSLVEFIDNNIKKTCIEKNIESPPTDNMVDNAFLKKMTKYSNCINMKL